MADLELYHVDAECRSSFIGELKEKSNEILM